MSSGDHVAMTMLAMAETLRQLQPPKVKMAIKCAKGALTLSLSAEMAAHVKFQLGKLYFFYTENLELALQYLDSAYEMMTRMGEYFIQPRLEALVLICEALIHGPSNAASTNRVLTLIRSELGNAKAFPTIYAKLFFSYIEVNTIEGRAEDAMEACQVAIQQCADDPVVNLYFRLTKNMVSARVSGTVCDDSETVIIGQLINRLDQSSPTTANLKLFYICTLLAFMLADGKTRSSRQHLRTLQSEVQALSKDGACIQVGIRWMDTVPLTVFACLMTIVNSALQCNYERAAKYYTIAMRHIQDYNARASRNPCEYGILRSVQRMRMALNEMMAQCNIMACHPSMAMDNIRDMVQFSQRHGSDLFEEFGPAIQSLLGHYCCYLREPEAAEKHFIAASKFKSCKDKNVWVMTHVNLAITYLAQCKHAEFYEIADQTLIAECMETAKMEDLFRLHGLSVLLFSVFVPVNAEVILPTLDWSKKGHDHSLHCWSNNTMARVLASHGIDNSAYIEAARKEMALLDEGVIRAEHQTNPSAALVQWFEGDPTAFLPKDD
ncbi:hypothetical protein NECAME_03432 [Necator americanus]|uniref:Cohesin loading complex subunit SCC4 homolog n=1 Tax=Necator americanus TaxID=51031 RepID=W2T3B6_NECAM|nr:hypothetical protein NECAME_03432 [Necator americanus]ETN76500.1 hypothetical protein NECAME_03432 [Necator americanus]